MRALPPFCDACQGAHDVGDDGSCAVQLVQNAYPILFWDPLADFYEEAALIGEAEDIVRRAAST
jgi:hypothetical protein